MKLRVTWMLLGLFALFAGMARGQLQLVPANEPARVFAGAARTFPIVWQNVGNNAVTAKVHLRLLQASSATTMTVGEAPWKKLQVLAGQTITERATLDFPEVKAETLFLVRWLEGTNHTFGTTEVLVYPTNLLAELKTLAGEDMPLGVRDPKTVLKPLLKEAGIEFKDVADLEGDGFHGKLIIIGPFTAREQAPRDFSKRIETWARKGAGVVWLQPPARASDPLQPSFYSVRQGDGAVVVVQSSVVANLTEDPQAQLNLLHCCRLARSPESPGIPNLNSVP